MFVGGLLAGVAFIVSGLLELKLEVRIVIMFYYSWKNFFCFNYYH